MEKAVSPHNPPAERRLPCVGGSCQSKGLTEGVYAAEFP